MGWADAVRRMKVRANAETPLDAETARKFGAEGIGLCRTEHMFFDAERIPVVREMILADNEKGRRKRARQAAARCSAATSPRSSASWPACRSPSGCSIRRCTNSCRTPRKTSPASPNSPASRPSCSRPAPRELHESNPMLGHRGCRLGVTYPEIYEMQARAIFEAALDVAKETGKAPDPRSHDSPCRDEARTRTHARPRRRHGRARLPRARRPGRLPRRHHDRTSRAPRCVRRRSPRKPNSSPSAPTTSRRPRSASRATTPRASSRSTKSAASTKRTPSSRSTATASANSCGIGCQRGRAARPRLKLGVCGEHGGDPASIFFFEEVGLDYVSASPFRVPVARLAAAHAVLKKAR